MSLQNKRILIGVACAFIILGTLITLYVNSFIDLDNKEEDAKVEGWTAFKKGALKNYSYIKKVEHYNFIDTGKVYPARITISYELDEDISKQQADAVLEYTYDYLKSKKVIEGLQKLFTQESGARCLQIDIDLYYHDIRNRYLYTATSTINEDNSLSEWLVEYDKYDSLIHR